MGRKRKDADVSESKESLDSDSETSDSLTRKPMARNAANARERARMRILSKAFSRLKTSLPWVPADTKLSKLDTLRLASSYITHLRQVLTEETPEPTPIHPINLTWPFSLHHKPGSFGEHREPGADSDEFNEFYSSPNNGSSLLIPEFYKDYMAPSSCQAKDFFYSNGQ